MGAMMERYYKRFVVTVESDIEYMLPHSNEVRFILDRGFEKDPATINVEVEEL